MFVVFLKFSENKVQAADHMEGHKAWIAKGFEDGVFLMAGSLKPGAGGAILAHNVSPDDLQARVNADPFVEANVVSAEIAEIEPARLDSRLEFLQA